MTAFAHYLPETWSNLHLLPSATDERRVVDVLQSERCAVGDLHASMRIGALIRHRGVSPAFYDAKPCSSPAVAATFDVVCLDRETVAHPCRRADEWTACPMCGDELAVGGCECGGRS